MNDTVKKNMILFILQCVHQENHNKLLLIFLLVHSNYTNGIK